jgi:Mn-dependent DtxR family transcriptional regulator
LQNEIKCDIIKIRGVNNMHLQESGEMYLETIYVLSKNGSAVRSLDVAEHMGFSKPSVSRAVGLLKNGGYITADSDGHLSLTEIGEDIAKKIYERHTILTRFLIGIGVDKQTATDDACKIEHDISDTSFEAIKRLSENE